MKRNPVWLGFREEGVSYDAVGEGGLGKVTQGLGMKLSFVFRAMSIH